ncbi:MAG: hypothetical protein AAF202_14065 [Pseudomonadota bacterium]
MFRFEDSMSSARRIQALIAGGLMTKISEDQEEPGTYAEDIRKACFELIT